MINKISHIGIAVKSIDEAKVFYEKLGTTLPMNIVSLSIISKLSGLISNSALETAIKESLKPSLHDLNIKAMKLGLEIAEQSRS